jgi:hypothetical protein
MNNSTERQMVLNSLALLLAVRCQSEDGTRQLLARFYHEMSEKGAKTFMNRTIMLLEPRERDWMRNLF